jgi:hypothetical protein
MNKDIDKDLENRLRRARPQMSQKTRERLDPEALRPQKKRLGVLFPALASFLLVAVVFGALISGGGNDNLYQQDGSSEARDSSTQPTDSIDALQSRPSTPGIIAPEPVPYPPPVEDDLSKPRQVEESASLTLISEDISATADEVIRISDANQGLVMSSHIDQGKQATLDIRVKRDDLEKVLAELSRVANVYSRQQSTQDVTAQFTSIEKQLQIAQSELRSLLGELEKASNKRERDQLKLEIETMQTQIDSWQSELKSSQQRVDYASIYITITAPALAEDGQFGPDDALDIVKRGLEVALALLIIVLPFILIVLLPLAIVHLYRRRQRRKMLD